MAPLLPWSEADRELVEPTDDGFRCLLLDPPWDAHKGGGGRGAQFHYDVMPVADIVATILRAELWRPAQDAHMWLWVTNPTIWNGEAKLLCDALGFRPISMCTWIKDRFGTGQYLRGQTEHLLLAVRGRGKAIATGQGVTYLEAPRTRHSAKPDAFYDMVEAVSPGPRVEFFARRRRSGWQAFGNELPEAA
jgi:N6-adenosine-specific RNA methylase IME4